MTRGLALYRQLYDIEERGREQSAEDRLALRRAESLPILQDLMSVTRHGRR